MDNPQEVAIERFDTAIGYMDKLFEFIPIISYFEVGHIIHLSSLPEEASDYATEINVLLLDKLRYADDYNGRYWITLNQKGIAAKKAGGHFKYEKLEAKKLRSEAISNWPKKYWWLVASVTLLVGWFGDLGKEALKDKIMKSQKESAPTIPTSIDSARNHKTAQ